MMYQAGSRKIPKKYVPWLIPGMIAWWLIFPAVGATIERLQTHSWSDAVLGALFGYCAATVGALGLIIAALVVSQRRRKNPHDDLPSPPHDG